MLIECFIIVRGFFTDILSVEQAAYFLKKTSLKFFRFLSCISIADFVIADAL